MEFASYLAGERWSDHPACTHPLLAALARLVNDNTTDESRSRLIHLVPSIIGLTSTDLRVDAHIALRCATTALPVAAAERQLALAVSVLAAEEMLARLNGVPPGRLSPRSQGGDGPGPAGGGPGTQVQPGSQDHGEGLPQVRGPERGATGRGRDRAGLHRGPGHDAARPADGGDRRLLPPDPGHRDDDPGRAAARRADGVLRVSFVTLARLT
ncbi:hypothetical protein ACFSTC_31025 [Nonomuraea ferruginea]